MNINLTPEMEKYVAEKVKSGAYASASEAVNDSLSTLKTQEEVTEEDVIELRAMIAVGVAQADRGESGPWDVEAFKARVREQLRRSKAS